MSDMSEQVELVGGPLDGQVLNVTFSHSRRTWAYELPAPGTAPASLMRNTRDYRRDPADPRRFVYVQEDKR